MNEAEPGRSSPWRLKVYETLGSTSDLCRSLAEAGEPAGLAVLTRRQEKGRGSRGRAWVGIPGNLFLSVLLRPPGQARLAGQWSLLAGVALVEALRSFLPPAADVTLKWPNDVLLGGAKLAGILIDAATNDSDGIDWLVIGMGANLAHAPELPDRPTACLATHASAPLPEDFAAILLARIEHWRHIHLRDGFAPIRTAWLAAAGPIGAPMTVKLGGDLRAGSFQGLAEDGSLLLQTGGRVHAFTAGEVLLGGA